MARWNVLPNVNRNNSNFNTDGLRTGHMYTVRHHIMQVLSCLKREEIFNCYIDVSDTISCLVNDIHVQRQRRLYANDAWVCEIR